jgi:hypothetical protein
MKPKMTTTIVKLTRWSKSRLSTLPPFRETSQFITKSEKTNTSYDLYQHPSTTPQHFMRYLEIAQTISYVNYDQYELVNDGSDFDNYALIVDDIWSLPALPCYH